MTLSDLTSIIVACSTLGSLLYIARQLSVTRRQSKGQFLLALDERFEKVRPTTFNIIDTTLIPQDNQWLEVWGYMTVFERISIMIEDGILDVPLVDRLYGVQLITLIANDAIYNRLLLSGAEWQDLVDLCYAIANERKKSGSTLKRDTDFVERVYKLTKTTRNPNSPLGF